MSASILVATPHATFGELLRISLEGSGRYQVRLVMSAHEMRTSASRGNFQLAILDSNLTDEPFVPLCMDLLEQQKNIRLVIIPPENDPNHPSLGGLLPHGYLSRPFYLPDLLELVSKLLNQPGPKINDPSPASVTIPDWLQEPSSLQEYLEKALPETQALAGMIGVYEQAASIGSLRACSGQLSESAVQEIVSVVFRHWNRDEKVDLMRFIRLSADAKDYLLYATRIKGELVLILVYETTASLSQIRPQTKALAQRLAARPPQDSPVSGSSEAQPPASPPAAVDAVPTGPPEDDDPTEPDIDQPPPAPASAENPVERLQENRLPDSQEEQDPSESGLSNEAIDLSALLSAIPRPDPQDKQDGGEIPQPPERFPPQAAPGPLDGWRVYGEPEPESTPVNPVPARANPTQPDQENRLTDPGQPVFNLNLAPDEIDELEDTRPHIVAALTSLSKFEPTSPALSQLNYTCVLIPRLPHHYLTGDLAERLSMWVQQFCLAFGWRLEGIAVRPEYLQWTVQVSPSISPGSLIRIIRQRTSLQIFNQFSNYSEQNPSGDFWATGYLIVSGSQPPSAQLLRDYITQTRKRQGIVR